jgi:hypothetical protein
MKTIFKLIAVAALWGPIRGAAGEPPVQGPATEAASHGTPLETPADPSDADRRAARRYDEMLDKMQAAVEEIAQLYGNPIFLQVFTNDPDRASDLKQRLKAAQTSEEIRKEVAKLEKKRDDLLSDIALREREVARVSGRLSRQRAALDAIAAAVEQARAAVENSSR